MPKRKTILRNRSLDLQDIKRMARERKELEAQQLALDNIQRANKIDRVFLSTFFEHVDSPLSNGMNARIWQLRQILKDNKKDNSKIKRLLLAIVKKGNDLLQQEYWTKLEILAECPWINEPENWKPRGKSSSTRFRSLVNFLIIKYPIPKCLYSIFNERVNHKREPYVKFLKEIIDGKSLYKTFKKDVLPISLSKRACHLLFISKETDFVAATRLAQLKSMDADQKITKAIMGSSLGRRFLDNEKFWEKVLLWMVHLKELDYKEVSPMVDYLKQRKEREAKFEIKGRSWNALMRAKKEWQEELNRNHRVKHVDFYPTKYKNGIYETSERLKNGCHIHNVWTVEEILSSSELSTEGSKMRHCVFLYTEEIMNGESSIWSLRKNGHRACTIELENESQKILQVRGKTNRLIRKEERVILDLWTKENGLKYDKYCLED